MSLGLNVHGWESSGELNVYAHVFVDEGLQCFLGRTRLLALGWLVLSLRGGVTCPWMLQADGNRGKHLYG